VAGPVRPRGTPMTSRHGDPVGARLRQFYAALIDERRLGARRSFFARVFSFSESLPRSATGAKRSLALVWYISTGRTAVRLALRDVTLSLRIFTEILRVPRRPRRCPRSPGSATGCSARPPTMPVASRRSSDPGVAVPAASAPAPAGPCSPHQAHDDHDAIIAAIERRKCAA